MTARRRLPRALLVLVAFAIAVGLVAAPPAVPEVRAALPSLTLVSNARYEVHPEDREVRVTVDIVARNRLKDTATRRYYFDRAFLAVQPGTSKFRITSTTGKPTVRVSQKRSQYQILAIGFGQRIYSQKQASFRLTFSIPDSGGAATRSVRVGQALVSFPAWAFASDDTPGSTVTVIFPKDFNVQLEAGSLPEPRVDEGGRTIFASGKLDAPLDFFAYFVADRPAAYEESSLTTTVGEADAELTVRAWPDDPEWAERVGSLFTRGLPDLQGLIGVPWPREDPLVVQESVSRTTGGYSGLFDPKEGRIEVAYYAEPFVVLHEAAHVWFNGSLLADRWANEGFASYYAQSAGGHLGEKVQPAELTDELRAGAFPLNAWGPTESADATDEAYGYAASLALAREIAKRAGHDGLRGVWQAVNDREAAYQRPAVDPGANPEIERADAAPDWRGLLDVLEDETGQSFEDLWREWVVRPAETAQLDARAEARATYARVLREAGRWELPASIRGALRAWQFETASTLLADADALLDRRTELETAAEDAGLRLPTRLEAAFEGEGGIEAANAEADAEAAAIAIVASATGARPARPDPIQQVGLIGETPDVQLDNARTAFAAGDLEGSAREAIRAEATWNGAWEVGRNRIATSAGIALLALLGLAWLVTRWRGRRRADRAAVTHPPTPDAPQPGGPAAS